MEENNKAEQSVPEEELPQEEARQSEPDWQAKIAEAERQRDEYLDSLRRAQADFINYKRHNERARTDGYDDGNREAIAAMLPAIDNLERAVQATEEQSALLDGVKMTLKLVIEALGKRGLAEIPAAGQPFDPELHHAVARGEGEGEPGDVIEVYQKGYKVKDKIIRYAMVKVIAE